MTWTPSTPRPVTRSPGPGPARGRPCSRSTPLRLWGHFEGDPQAYRPELADVPGRDPIPVYEQRLTEAGVLRPGMAAAIKDEASARVEKAIAFAKSSPVPAPETALQYVFA